MKINEVFKNIEANLNGFEKFEVNKVGCVFEKNESFQLIFVFENNINFFLNNEKEISEWLNNGGKVVFVAIKPLSTLPTIVVRDVRASFSQASANFYGNVHKELDLVVVTGTKGKTSTCHFIEKLLKNCGLEFGNIGTHGAKFLKNTFESNLTTPDPNDLHRIFKEMKAKGCDRVVFEGSAHALELKKLYGTKPFIGAFTNCTRDHLDFFKSIETYQEAKKKLFSELRPVWQVINIDDAIAKSVEMTDNTITIGKTEKADIYFENVITKFDENNGYIGVNFDLVVFNERINTFSQLFGEFNLYNLMIAVAVAYIYGIGLTEIARNIKKVNCPKGRCQKFDNNQGLNIYIDFAHTPNSMESFISEVRKNSKGKIITVFGCGGDRDKGKRPIMGEIAVKLSDYTVITSDNPRYEKPLDIIADIESGLKNIEGDYATFSSREVAIRYAIKIAKNGDNILILGKGDEKYMDIQGEKLAYSDFETLCKILN